MGEVIQFPKKHPSTKKCCTLKCEETATKVLELVDFDARECVQKFYCDQHFPK